MLIFFVIRWIRRESRAFAPAVAMRRRGDWDAVVARKPKVLNYASMGLAVLPEIFGQLSRLRTLNLEENHLSSRSGERRFLRPSVSGRILAYAHSQRSALAWRPISARRT